MSECPIPRSGRNTRICAIWDHLNSHGDMRASELAAAMGVSQHAATASIVRYRSAHPGVFRISSWHRYVHSETRRAGGGDMAPVWSVTPGDDAPQPRRLSAKQALRQHYLRNRAEILLERAKARVENGVCPRKPTWLRGLI